MTSRQLMALTVITHLPHGKASLSKIAEKLGIAKQGMTDIIGTMEKKGYVTVTPSITDKRSCNVEITEKGRLVSDKCLKTGMEFLFELFKNYSEEENILINYQF